MLIFLIFKVSFTIIIVLVVNGQHLITDLDLIIDLNIYWLNSSMQPFRFHCQPLPAWDSFSGSSDWEHCSLVLH